MGEKLSLVSLPMFVPIYHFDGDNGKGENDGEGNSKEREELKYYNQRKTQEIAQGKNLPSHEPIQDSISEPLPETGNVTIPKNSNLDQPIALRKGMRSCT